VPSHEMGHAMGLGHSASGVMSEQLQAGQRATPDVWGAGLPGTAQEPALATPAFDAPHVEIDWSSAWAPAPQQSRAPQASAKAVVGDAWQQRFVNHLGATPDKLNPNAKLRIMLPVAPRISNL
jgi:hypothetical protein